MKKNRQKITLFTLAIFLTACSSTKINLESKVQLPANFEQTQQATGTNEILQWWKNWQDPVLSQLISQGLQNNHDIAIAKARLQEAQANSHYVGADLGPSANIQENIYGVLSQTSQLSDSSRTNTFGNIQTLGVKASWEPDFFGQKRSNLDAAQAMQLESEEQVHAAQILMASQIAESYFNIQAIRQQQGIFKQIEHTLGRLKIYLQQRFSAGQANVNDILQVESRISSIQARQSTLNSQIAKNERNIAILIGQTPQHFKIEKNAVNFSKVLPLPPSGIFPSDIIERRPDLRSARHHVQAEAAKFASAKADLYPRFDIQFLGQTGRIDLNTAIPDLKGWSGLLSAGISLPIFTNGRIEANIDASDARLKQALLQYDKVLLQSLSDVDNSYQQYFALKKQTERLQQAVKQSQKQVKNSEKLFKYDARTLDQVLSDQLTALDYQEQLIQCHLQQAKNLVDLYNVIGGGWSK